MKKLLLVLTLFLTVGLAACSDTTETTLTTATTDSTTALLYDSPMKVIVPNGAPALSQIFMQENENFDVSVVNGADPLAAAFLSGSHDFIFAPTNLGAKLYNSGIEYQLIAAITFGNYYLVSMEDNFSIESLEGKEIVVFGQNSTSDIVLQYVLDSNEINATFRYVSSVGDANAEFVLDNDIIILSAEPMLSILANTVSGFNTIDLQDEYQQISGVASYPQAGVFVKTGTQSEYINDFLDKLEASVALVNSDLDATVAKAGELEYSFPASVLTSAIPNSHIGFVTASDVRTDLESYFNIILDMNGALLGDTLPDDNFYFE